MPPSGTPVKELILQDIETTLAAITAGSAYYTSVAVVDRINTIPVEIRDYPAIVLTPLGTDYDQPGDARTTAIGANYRVRATLVARTRTDAAATIENFIRDVHKALLVDITRGGEAINTRMLSDSVFYPTQIEEPVAIADCIIEVRYRTLRTDLNTAT
tara:strand:+ start:2030 stop:2503 length:474 start_codon:yes stop_codon:yes gene_type:complete